MQLCVLWHKLISLRGITSCTHNNTKPWHRAVPCSREKPTENYLYTVQAFTDLKSVRMNWSEVQHHPQMRIQPSGYKVCLTKGHSWSNAHASQVSLGRNVPEEDWHFSLEKPLKRRNPLGFLVMPVLISRGLSYRALWEGSRWVAEEQTDKVPKYNSKLQGQRVSNSVSSVC